MQRTSMDTTLAPSGRRNQQKSWPKIVNRAEVNSLLTGRLASRSSEEIRSIVSMSSKISLDWRAGKYAR